MTIAIEDEIRRACPGAALGVLHYHAEVGESGPALLALFDRTVEDLARRYALDQIAALPHVAATRAAYKTLGQDPHRHRNAAEAMLRRIVKGQGLYRINSVVEVNNLISVTSGYAVGTYDVGELTGGIVLRRAPDGACYDGIGKGRVDIAHLPVLYDETGAFGNPTSDSQRAMVRPGRRELLTVVYAFDGPMGLAEELRRAQVLLERHCGVRGIETWVV